MNQQSPYTENDQRKVTVAAAFLGWSWVTFWEIGLRFELIPFAALLGLPVAFIATYLIGKPILRNIMRRSISFPHAALAGGFIAALMSLTGIAIGCLLGWLESIDDSRYSQIGGGEYVRSVDGILTPYGWLIVLQDSLLLIAAGMVIGVLMRAWIGPGRLPTS